MCRAGEGAQTSGREIAGEYLDRGVSGAKERRPELDRPMRSANRGASQAAGASMLERHGGFLRHLVNALAELEHRAIAFISQRDNIHLSTPARRVTFHIVGAMAEFERALTTERVSAGSAAARAKRKRLGRPPREGLDAARPACLRAQGRPRREIGHELGIGTSTARAAFLERAKHVSPAAPVNP